jgi:hypothetical protein
MTLQELDINTSAEIREDVKGHNLSFTEIAKLVGESWQMLTPAQKEPYETQAATAKEKYIAELANYKRTDSYKEYMQYLAEFKAKHGSVPSGKVAPSRCIDNKQDFGNVTKRKSINYRIDGKRPKLEKVTSNLSNAASIRHVESTDSLAPLPPHSRGASVGSVSHPSSISSPSSAVPPFFGPVTGQQVLSQGQRASPATDSPSPFMPPRAGVLNVSMVSRTGQTPDFHAEPQNLSSQVSVGALIDSKDVPGYYGYGPNSAMDTSGDPRLSSRTAAPLRRQETAASRSSLSSGLSSESTSSTPGFPRNPGDDSWAQRPIVTQGLTPGDSMTAATDFPRPLRAPLTGSIGANYPNLPPLRFTDRIVESTSPTGVAIS